MVARVARRAHTLGDTSRAAPQKFGRHLVGVWIGGVWNCHFSIARKYFSEAEFCSKIPEFPQKEQFSPNFRLWNLNFQGPKKSYSVPPATLYPPLELLPKTMTYKTNLGGFHFRLMIVNHHVHENHWVSRNHTWKAGILYVPLAANYGC